MPEYVQYRFLETVPCLTAAELAAKLHIPENQFYAAVEALAKDRQVYDSLHHFVNIFAAAGRHLLPDGKKIEEPQDVEVLCIKEHSSLGLKVGDRTRIAHDQAVELAKDRYVIIL